MNQHVVAMAVVQTFENCRNPTWQVEFYQTMLGLSFFSRNRITLLVLADSAHAIHKCLIAIWESNRKAFAKQNTRFAGITDEVAHANGRKSQEIALRWKAPLECSNVFGGLVSCATVL